MNGRDAIIIPGLDGEDGFDAFPIPGPRGEQGIQGVPGASGGGSSGPLIWIPDVEDTDLFRHPPAIDSNNLVYLNRITGTGVTVGPLIWNENFDLIFFNYQIGGYNGGTPVGRLLCGSASISTTALTNGSSLLEGATLNVTSLSKPGVPLAVTLSNVARSGHGVIRGASGALKQIDIQGMSGNPAVAAAPLMLNARSFFSDLGTNLPIKRIQLTVYDTLVATAVSAQTFTATTFIEAWGLRKSPR